MGNYINCGFNKIIIINYRVKLDLFIKCKFFVKDSNKNIKFYL